MAAAEGELVNWIWDWEQGEWNGRRGGDGGVGRLGVRRVLWGEKRARHR